MSPWLCPRCEFNTMKGVRAVITSAQLLQNLYLPRRVRLDTGTFRITS
jgi:hypothetical protein